jgi:hypothetical protein
VAGAVGLFPRLVAEEAAGYGGGRISVLERIEELEVREREKEELLAWVTAMAEEHGLDVESLKAVLGGGVVR